MKPLGLRWLYALAAESAPFADTTIHIAYSIHGKIGTADA